jgi:hypothetical protein
MLIHYIIDYADIITPHYLFIIDIAIILTLILFSIIIISLADILHTLLFSLAIIDDIIDYAIIDIDTLLLIDII